MNERIKELAKDHLVRDERTEFGWQECHKYEFDESELAKFAELIVAECSRVIVNGGYWSGGPLGPKRQCTPPEIATMIKEHFGVKE